MHASRALAFPRPRPHRAVFNWSLPLAAYLDTKRSPEFISPNMTLALSIYSGLFMRFAWMVKPRNYLLFACHATNETLQLTQAYRYLTYDPMYACGVPGRT